MSVNLSPVAGAAAQFLDNSGNVLTGGKLYTYLAGTTTPAATYTSSLGITFHSNPIILDAAGRVPNGGEIWLSDNVQYKFVLKDANDVLIGTWDNLTGINSNFVNYTSQEEIIVATAGQTVFNLTTVTYVPGTNSLQVYVDGVNQYDGVTYAYIETDANTVTFTAGLHVGALVKFTTAISVSAGTTNANLVIYDPPFTGAVTTNVENKLAETVSVKDFGAVGDGITDDTTAIQAFFDLTAANKLFDAGTYKTSTAVIIKKTESIYSANAKILFTGSGVNAVEIRPVSGLINKLHINGHLTIERSTINYADTYAGLYLEALYSSVLNISIANFEKGIHSYGNGTYGVTYNQIFIGELANCKYSQYFSSAAGGWANANIFYGGRYYGGTAGMANHIEMDTTNYDFNGNKWLFPSLESTVAGHLLFNLKGLNNQIFIGYAEHKSAVGVNWAILGGSYNSVQSNTSYINSASINDATARLNITGTYCDFYGNANQIRNTQGLAYSRYITADTSLPAATFENSSGSGTTALDVLNSSNGGLDAFRVLNPDGTPGVTMAANGRSWQVRGNQTGTIKKSVLWTEAIAPASGTWVRGDIAWATNPSAGGYAGWICVASGTPGTWKQFGAIVP